MSEEEKNGERVRSMQKKGSQLSLTHRGGRHTNLGHHRVGVERIAPTARVGSLVTVDEVLTRELRFVISIRHSTNLFLERTQGCEGPAGAAGAL